VNGPTVCCVIPAHNAAAYVGQAVQSALEQTYAVDQVIVVDDGSTDDTAEVLAEFGDRVRVIRQEQGGVAAARNAGAAAATTQWIALLDADDWWLPHKTERMVGAIEQDSGVAMVYAGRWIHDEATGERHAPELVYLRGQVYHELLRGNVVPTSSVLVRRDVWVALGGMALSLVTCEDWDLWIRIARAHRVGCVPERLCVYRKHVGGMSQEGEVSTGTSDAVARMRRDEREVLGRAEAADPGLGRRMRARAWSAHDYRCGMDAYGAEDFRTARRLFARAVRGAWHGPAARRYLATLLGTRVLRCVRGRRGTDG